MSCIVVSIVCFKAIHPAVYTNSWEAGGLRSSTALGELGDKPLSGFGSFHPGAWANKPNSVGGPPGCGKRKERPGPCLTSSATGELVIRDHADRQPAPLSFSEEIYAAVDDAHMKNGNKRYCAKSDDTTAPDWLMPLLLLVARKGRVGMTGV